MDHHSPADRCNPRSKAAVLPIFSLSGSGGGYHVTASCFEVATPITRSRNEYQPMRVKERRARGESLGFDWRRESGAIDNRPM